jgi:hypothetical protein
MKEKKNIFSYVKKNIGTTKHLERAPKSFPL